MNVCLFNVLKMYLLLYCQLYAIIFKFQNWDQIVLHKVQEDFTMYANSKSIPVMFSLHIDGQIN